MTTKLGQSAAVNYIDWWGLSLHFENVIVYILQVPLTTPQWTF